MPSNANRDQMSPARKKMIAAYFQDPIAAETDWRPLKRGGATFISSTLRHVNAQRIEVHASKRAKVFAVAFHLGFAIVLSVAIVYSDYHFFIFVVGFLLCVSFILSLRQLRRLVVFDVSQGFFWAGIGSSPQSKQDAFSTLGTVQISDIYALQIISEVVKVSGGGQRKHRPTFVSYEMNLVRRDGRRVNVMDHGDLDEIQCDAKDVAKFLGIPVWDASKVP